MDKALIGDDMSEVVCATGLSKAYPGRMAVDGIDFKVCAGECFGILGPNGAGKSTTLRMVIGLTSLDKGALELFGQPMYPEHPTTPQRMGVVPQRRLNFGPGTFPWVKYFSLWAIFWSI